MAKKSKIIELTLKRKSDGTVGGPLMINYESTEQERKEAFNALLVATLKVSKLFHLDDAMYKAACEIAFARPR